MTHGELQKLIRDNRHMVCFDGGVIAFGRVRDFRPIFTFTPDPQRSGWQDESTHEPGEFLWVRPIPSDNAADHYITTIVDDLFLGREIQGFEDPLRIEFVNEDGRAFTLQVTVHDEGTFSATGVLAEPDVFPLEDYQETPETKILGQLSTDPIEAAAFIRMRLNSW